MKVFAAPFSPKKVKIPVLLPLSKYFVDKASYRLHILRVCKRFLAIPSEGFPFTIYSVSIFIFQLGIRVWCSANEMLLSI